MATNHRETTMSRRTALLATAVAFAFTGTAYAEGCDKVIF
jgi:hypothetical protein